MLRNCGTHPAVRQRQLAQKLRDQRHVGPAESEDSDERVPVLIKQPWPPSLLNLNLNVNVQRCRILQAVNASHRCVWFIACRRVCLQIRRRDHRANTAQEPESFLHLWPSYWTLTGSVWVPALCRLATADTNSCLLYSEKNHDLSQRVTSSSMIFKIKSLTLQVYFEGSEF